MLKSVLFYFFIFSYFNIFYWLCYYSCPIFSPLYSPLPCTHPPTSIPPHPISSWVIHIRSLASPFPILFLTSSCLFSTYHLCFLFHVPFPPFSLLPLPADDPPCDFHFWESLPVLVVCLVYFVFAFRFVCW